MRGQDVAVRLLGGPVAHAPFLAERLAVDLTAGLVAAGQGLQAFRRRPLLRRLWDDVTGQTQEKAVTIGADLLAVQEATMGVVRIVMEETGRSQHCLNRVLTNLRQVNHDFDKVQQQAAQTATHQAQFQKALQANVVHVMKQIDHVNHKVDRLALLRQLQNLFQTGKLHPGTGPLLGSAMYWASITLLFEGDVHPGERDATLAVVEQRVGREVDFLPEMLARDVIGLDSAALETVRYLADRSGESLLIVVATLAQKLAQFRVPAEDALRTAEQSFRQLPRDAAEPCFYLRRPTQVVEQLARELLGPLGELAP